MIDKRGKVCIFMGYGMRNLCMSAQDNTKDKYSFENEAEMYLCCLQRRVGNDSNGRRGGVN